MPAKSNWTMTLYANATDVTPSTSDATYGGGYVLISALTSPSTKTIYILAPQFDYTFNTTTLEDVSGDRVGYTTRRIKFDIESYPFSYNATSVTLEQDVEDLIAVANLIDNSAKRYLYLRIDGGSRAYPAATYVYPVTLTNWSTSINKQYGNRIVTFSFEHRERN
jgi:hypothetical protein